jgi:hypothetical protein
MRKALVAIVSLGCVVAGILLGHIDPNFQHAAVLLTGSVFSVIGVAMAKNHTEEDLSKAVAHALAAAVTLVAFFATVKTSTVGDVSLILGAAVTLYGVWRVPNANPRFVAAIPPPPPQKA